MSGERSRACGVIVGLTIACAACGGAASERLAAQTPSVEGERGFVTRGLASDIKPGAPVTACTSGLVRAGGGGGGFNAADVGTVTAGSGQRFTVPASVHAGPAAVDLYNNCTGQGDNPGYASQLKTVVIDEDGVEITGFIFADNYFEVYVNGRFVGRDAIGMTPFNSSVVRFRARYPMTYAIMGVDWELHLGVGMEYDSFNVGDGGFIAYFSDGNGTDGDWRAETFYIAPLDDPGCVRTAVGRDSTSCSGTPRPACAEKDPKSCQALHFPIAADWTSPKFDDSRWPRAVVWPAEAVTGQRAYTGYRKFFGNAEFLWTRNLRLDNLVLARHTATGPRR